VENRPADNLLIVSVARPLDQGDGDRAALSDCIGDEKIAERLGVASDLELVALLADEETSIARTRERSTSAARAGTPPTTVTRRTAINTIAHGIVICGPSGMFLIIENDSAARARPVGKAGPSS
jgi:hypothetical protein